MWFNVLLPFLDGPVDVMVYKNCTFEDLGKWPTDSEKLIKNPTILDQSWHSRASTNSFAPLIYLSARSTASTCSSATSIYPSACSRASAPSAYV